MLKFAEGTYNIIYGKLGNPDIYDTGFEITDIVLGQTVEDRDDGQFYTPAMVEFTAQVVTEIEEEGSRKKWNISRIRKIQ